MEQINWKQKLSSRKLWALITALVVSLGILYKVDENTIQSVTATIGCFASIVTYIFAEGLVDSNRSE